MLTGLHWQVAAMVRMTAIGSPPNGRVVRTSHRPTLQTCLRLQVQLLGTTIRAEFRIL